MKTRLDLIDYAKGICILLVVFGHVVEGTNSVSITTEHSIYSIMNGIVYNFHMPAFFLLSGLLVGDWLKNDFSLALKKKLSSLMYPYAVWCLITAVIRVVFSKIDRTNFKFTDVLTAVYNPFSVYWFLYVLFFIFLLYYALSKVVSKKVIVFISIVLYLCAPFDNFWILQLVSKNFVYFCIGGLLINNSLMEKIKKPSYIRLVIAICLFLILNISYVVGFNTIHSFYTDNRATDASYFQYLSRFVLALTGIYLVMLISSKLANLLKFTFLKYLGINSLIIYVFHLFPADASRILLQKLFHINNPHIHVFMGLFIGIVVPLLCYQIARKLRIEQFFYGFKIKNNKKFTDAA